MTATAETARAALRRRMLDQHREPLPRHCQGCGGELAETDAGGWRHTDAAGECDESWPVWQCHVCGGEASIVETSPVDVRTSCLTPGCGRHDAFNLDAVATGPEADRLWEQLGQTRAERVRAYREFWGTTVE